MSSNGRGLLVEFLRRETRAMTFFLLLTSQKMKGFVVRRRKTPFGIIFDLGPVVTGFDYRRATW